jgi:hypothetical protein
VVGGAPDTKDPPVGYWGSRRRRGRRRQWPRRSRRGRAEQRLLFLLPAASHRCAGERSSGEVEEEALVACKYPAVAPPPLPGCGVAGTGSGGGSEQWREGVGSGGSGTVVGPSQPGGGSSIAPNLKASGPDVKMTSLLQDTAADGKPLSVSSGGG